MTKDVLLTLLARTEWQDAIEREAIAELLELHGRADIASLIRRSKWSEVGGRIAFEEGSQVHRIRFSSDDLQAALFLENPLDFSGIYPFLQSLGRA